MTRFGPIVTCLTVRIWNYVRHNWERSVDRSFLSNLNFESPVSLTKLLEFVLTPTVSLKITRKPKRKNNIRQAHNKLLIYSYALTRNERYFTSDYDNEIYTAYTLSYTMSYLIPVKNNVFRIS